MSLLKLEKNFRKILSQKQISKEKGIELLSNYNSDDYKKYIKYSTENYSRNYVIKTEEFDILILCWLPKQKTQIHWHPRNWCFVKVLEWEVKETLYTIDKKIIKQNTYKTSDCTYNHDSLGYHTLKNTRNTNAITLHIYAPWSYTPNFL